MPPQPVRGCSSPGLSSRHSPEARPGRRGCLAMISGPELVPLIICPLTGLGHRKERTGQQWAEANHLALALTKPFASHPCRGLCSISRPPGPTPSGLLPPLVFPSFSLGPLPSACPTPSTPTWLPLMLQIIPAVAKPLPCKWAAFQCVCVCVCVCMHAHTCMHRGGGLAGKEACLCLAHCLREFMPFPTNLWSPALPANLHWALIDRVWLSGQGAEMPNWRVLGSLSSPFSSMGCSWTQRVAEPPPTQLLRPPGPWGDRINLGVQDGCWEDFSGI